LVSQDRRESPFPEKIPNWINGQQHFAISRGLFDKLNPASGEPLWRAARSGAEDVQQAITAAIEAQSGWSDIPPVKRGEILYDVASGLREHRQEVARVVALETGKSHKAALEETNGAVALGMFMAGEGQRLYGRTTTSGTANRYAMTIRQPLGVAGLIVPANTPIANVAWKVFPALVCGNAAILKASEDAPATAWLFSKIAHESGLPKGVLNVIQGYGEEAGAPLIDNPAVAVISFTGSTAVGREIAMTAGKRLARVSLELGGKNPFVVCDDANLDLAVRWALLSAFSNAGQRCASGSRLIIFASVYDRFRDMLKEGAAKLRVGPADEDDFGPVINEKHLKSILGAMEKARAKGAHVITGGYRLTDPDHVKGFYLAPTLLENVDPGDDISATELFGPVACLYKVKDFSEALSLSNNSSYGLTACIHTGSLHRAMQFTQKIQSGVVAVNAGTYGSEPHMPFGGVKQSGNGTREPGTEALDIYSNLKDVYISIDPKEL